MTLLTAGGRAGRLAAGQNFWQVQGRQLTTLDGSIQDGFYRTPDASHGGPPILDDQLLVHLISDSTKSITPGAGYLVQRSTSMGQTGETGVWVKCGGNDPDGTISGSYPAAGIEAVLVRPPAGLTVESYMKKNGGSNGVVPTGTTGWTRLSDGVSPVTLPALKPGLDLLVYTGVGINGSVSVGLPAQLTEVAIGDQFDVYNRNPVHSGFIVLTGTGLPAIDNFTNFCVSVVAFAFHVV